MADHILFLPWENSGTRQKLKKMHRGFLEQASICHYFMKIAEIWSILGFRFKFLKVIIIGHLKLINLRFFQKYLSICQAVEHSFHAYGENNF
jgi:hypothetical protein